MFRYGLSWPAARGLLSEGAYVRRELWSDKRLFLSPGGLVWVDGDPPRVVRGADFGREEFLALDWTDMGFDQRDCVDHPGWTYFLIDETESVRVVPPVQRTFSAGADVRSVRSPFNYAPVVIPNPLGVSCLVTLSGTCDDYLLLNGKVVATTWGGGFPSIQFQLAAGGSFTLAAKNRSPYYASDWVGYSVTANFVPQGVNDRAVRLYREYVNPFSAPCVVAIAGSASDALMVNSSEVALPVSFTLAAGASFSLAAMVRNPLVQPVASLNVEVTLSL